MCSSARDLNCGVVLELQEAFAKAQEDGINQNAVSLFCILVSNLPFLFVFLELDHFLAFLYGNDALFCMETTFFCSCFCPHCFFCMHPPCFGGGLQEAISKTQEDGADLKPIALPYDMELVQLSIKERKFIKIMQGREPSQVGAAIGGSSLAMFSTRKSFPMKYQICFDF